MMIRTLRTGRWPASAGTDPTWSTGGQGPDFQELLGQEGKDEQHGSLAAGKWQTRLAPRSGIR